MPIKKSAMKALRQSSRRAAHNAKIKSDVTALVRHVRKAVSAKKAADAAKWLPQAIKRIDKAAQKRVIKKNTAARLKSRLSTAVAGLNKK